MSDVCDECGTACEPRSIAYLSCDGCGGRWMTDSAIDDLSAIVARLRSDLASARAQVEPTEAVVQAAIAYCGPGGDDLASLDTRVDELLALRAGEKAG